MKKYLASTCVFVFAFLLCITSAAAQKETASGIEIDKNLELMRKDLRAEKKKILAMNVPMTEVEATKFWPIYDQYASDMSTHYNDFYAVIKDYAANQKTLTDAQAVAMIKKWSTIQVELAQTRQKWISQIERALPGKKAALFFQIDRRLYALMDLQVASEVPLVLQ